MWYGFCRAYRKRAWMVSSPRTNRSTQWAKASRFTHTILTPRWKISLPFLWHHDLVHELLIDRWGEVAGPASSLPASWPRRYLGMQEKPSWQTSGQGLCLRMRNSTTTSEQCPWWRSGPALLWGWDKSCSRDSLLDAAASWRWCATAAAALLYWSCWSGGSWENSRECSAMTLWRNDRSMSTSGPWPSRIVSNSSAM